MPKVSVERVVSVGGWERRPWWQCRRVAQRDGEERVEGRRRSLAIGSNMTASSFSRAMDSSSPANVVH